MTVHLPMSAAEAALIAEPIARPFVAGKEVHLADRDGPNDTVTVHFDDVVVLSDPGEPVSLSRLGLINALLDQVYPGVALVTHVVGPTGEVSSEDIYGLELRQV